MTCANCTNAAQYVYEISEVHTIAYCFDHLPKFLESQKKAGTLKTPESFKSVQAEAIAAIEKKAVKKAKDTSEEESTPTPAE